MDLKAIEERWKLAEKGLKDPDHTRYRQEYLYSSVQDIPALVARVKALEAALLDIEPRLNDVREFVADFEAIGDTEESCQRIALKDIGWIRQRISGALSPTESDTPSGRG